MQNGRPWFLLVWKWFPAHDGFSVFVNARFAFQKQRASFSSNWEFLEPTALAIFFWVMSVSSFGRPVRRQVVTLTIRDESVDGEELVKHIRESRSFTLPNSQSPLTDDEIAQIEDALRTANWRVWNLRKMVTNERVKHRLMVEPVERTHVDELWNDFYAAFYAKEWSRAHEFVKLASHLCPLTAVKMVTLTACATSETDEPDTEQQYWIDEWSTMLETMFVTNAGDE